MTKVTAGVATGLFLGAAHGVVMGWGEPRGYDLFLLVLARASQGVITGVLTAYLTKGKTPLWRGALAGIAVGVATGALAALPDHAWLRVIPPSAAVGLFCGLATARASG